MSASHFENGRLVTDWWTETRWDGVVFYRRWVRGPDGWDYEDRDEAPE